MEDIRNAHKVLVREPEVKEPFGRPRHIPEDNGSSSPDDGGSKDL
jgi:hypothetical protein